MKTITLEESYFEHLLACLANQKYIREVNADGLSMGKEKVMSIQAEMQATIDKAYFEGWDLLRKNRGNQTKDEFPDPTPDKLAHTFRWKCKVCNTDINTFFKEAISLEKALQEYPHNFTCCEKLQTEVRPIHDDKTTSETPDPNEARPMLGEGSRAATLSEIREMGANAARNLKAAVEANPELFTKPKGRYLPDVIRSMIDAVPVREADLLTDLQKKLVSASYSAPEGMKIWWDEVAILLEEYFPDPIRLQDWQQQVINIYIDKK